MNMIQDQLARNETIELIASGKVEGTPVYSPDGDRLGTVSKLMINKKFGRVSYVVISFGGFLGLGEELHPLPWETLDYSPELGGYVVALPRGTAESARRTAARDGLDEAVFGDRGPSDVPPRGLA